VPEARLSDTPHGRAVQTQGWFVLNLGEATAMEHDLAGISASFEPQEARFPEFGLNVRVLEPGQPSALYHREDAQEAFLVLWGRCRLVIEDEERDLRRWDLVHCPPGTAHVVVGAGDGPSAVLMVGARKEGKALQYPASEVAARHGAAVAETTDSPPQAYASAGWKPQFAPVRLPWPPDGGAGR
jgi:uncharacterized cupin superfamily protein